jgi:uncharacterized protein (DUF1697 family)
VSTYVALLRGVNVGGRGKVSMKELRQLFEDLGYTGVLTYIQSGNVVFDAARPPASPAAIEKHIADRFGFDVAVVLRTPKELAAIIARCPYPDPTKVHVMFLNRAPAKAAFAKLDATAFRPDEFTVAHKELYLHLPNGVGQSKLPAALARQAPPEATMRNWRTVTKLLELSQRRAR